MTSDDLFHSLTPRNPSILKGMKTPTEMARDALAQADALVITAGAGMGVDSGLPDYRGREGFWRHYPPRLTFEAMGCISSYKVKASTKISVS